MAKEIKPGFKTTEFWLSILGMAAPFVATYFNKLPAEWAAGVSGIVAILYGATRMKTKSNA